MPTLFASVATSCAISGCVQHLAGDLFEGPCDRFGRLRWDVYGVDMGEGFPWYWVPTARLHEQVEPGAFFPLQALGAYPVRRHPGPPDALVCGPHKRDDDPTLDVYVFPCVGLPPLFCKATGYPFQGSFRLHTQYPVKGGNEGR